jgi:hypothetical protein
MGDFNSDDISDLSVETLLSSLSLDIMRDNITQQINGTLVTNQNYLSIVVSKFDEIIDEIVDNDILIKVKQEMIEFCRDLILKLVGQWNLAFDDPNEDTLEYIEILEVLYNFFILSNVSNVKKFMIEYIKSNKKVLIDTLNIGGRSGDITTIANKKKNFDKDNVVVLSNIDTIINYVKDIDFDSFDFMTIIDDGDYYANQLVSHMTSCTIIGNFAGHYINSALDDYSGPNSTDIRNSIRLAFCD